jgi:hypothetical protein
LKDECHGQDTVLGLNNAKKKERKGKKDNAVQKKGIREMFTGEVLYIPRREIDW